MDDPVSSDEISDLAYEVAKDQLGRKKNFTEILSKVLKVQGEYQVNQIHFYQLVLI